AGRREVSGAQWSARALCGGRRTPRRGKKRKMGTSVLGPPKRKTPPRGEERPKLKARNAPGVGQGGGDGSGPCPGEGGPRVGRKSPECAREEYPVAVEWRGRPGPVDQNHADVRRGGGLFRHESRRPQSALRHSRTWDGVDTQRAIAEQTTSARFHVPDLQ